MLLYQQHHSSLNESQESSQESAYRKNAFTGINTYKKEIDRNKNGMGNGSSSKKQKLRMQSEGTQLAQTTKNTMRKEENGLEKANGGITQFGMLSSKNYSKQYYSNGAHNQKPMTAGYDLNKKARRRNIEVKQVESYQSYSP